MATVTEESLKPLQTASLFYFHILPHTVCTIKQLTGLTVMMDYNRIIIPKFELYW